MVEVMKIMATSFKRSHVCTATLTAPNTVVGHHQPTPPLETPGHSQTSLGQSLVGGGGYIQENEDYTGGHPPCGMSSSSHILGAPVLGSNQGKASHLGGLEGIGLTRGLWEA